MNKKALEVLQEIEQAGSEGVLQLMFGTHLLTKLVREKYISITGESNSARCIITRAGREKLEQELNGEAKK